MTEMGAEPAKRGREKLGGFLRRLAEWYFELAHRTIVAGAILYACKQLTSLEARVIEVLTVSFLAIWTVASASHLAGEVLPNWPPRMRRESLGWRNLLALVFLVGTVVLQIRLVTLVMSVVQVLAKRAE